MRASNVLSNLVALGIVAAIGYLFVNWNSGITSGDENSMYAERSCVDEMRSRYDPSRVRMNSVKPTNGGYVVKGSITLARGNIAKVTCLTNEHGRVRDVIIEER
jgi:flagellar basal body-associated protein FliL